MSGSSLVGGDASRRESYRERRHRRDRGVSAREQVRDRAAGRRARGAGMV